MDERTHPSFHQMVTVTTPRVGRKQGTGHAGEELGWEGLLSSWMEGPYPSMYIFTVTVCNLLYSLCSCCEHLHRILNIVQKTRWKWLQSATSRGRLELTELFFWWIRSSDRRIGTEGPRSPA